MPAFVMRKRPKKPSKPRSVREEVGESIPIEYLLSEAAKFAQFHNIEDINTILLEVNETCAGGWEIFFAHKGSTYAEYLSKLEDYKLELKDYERWREKNKKQIERHKKEIHGS